MNVKLQYMGKLLFWTFMSIVPDAPASGRTLHDDPGLLTKVITWKMRTFVVMLLLLCVTGMMILMI